ncbi:MAG: T9SS type A sorting domain-containing protein [Bacteroidaceae bacterium]|nr:T9SS type A sorting domain-containing protein [Bacteroidaceae bacterium]
MKRIWIIALSMLLLGAVPSIAHMQMEEPIEAEMEAVTLTIQDNKAHITNADGKTLEIYNLTGVRVARIRIDSNDKQIALNLTRGCYIMKVGKVVRKVTIL